MDTETETENTARHEAGHLVAHLLAGAVSPTEANIIPTCYRLGRVKYLVPSTPIPRRATNRRYRWGLSRRSPNQWGRLGQRPWPPDHPGYYGPRP